MKLRPISIHRLLAVGASVIALGACLTILAVAILSSRSWLQVQRQTELVLQEQTTAERIVRQAQDQVMLASYYLRDPGPRLAERFRARGDGVFHDLRQYLLHDLSVEERALVEQMKTAHQAMEGTALLVFDLVPRGDVENARLLTDRMVDQTELLQDRMEQLMTLRRHRLDSLKAEHQVVMTEMFTAMTILALLLLVGIYLFSRIIQQRLLRPLDQLSDAALRLGGGDLGVRVGVLHSDEIGAVARSFNQMAERLLAARAELQTRNEELAGTLETLRTTQQEVLQTEKLTALGGMLAGLAHELNNPLASVLGYAELLHQDTGASGDARALEWQQELVRPLLSEALRARDLMRNLLRFTRSPGSTLAATSLDEALQVALDLRKYSFVQANLSVRLDVQSGLWVTAEAQRLQQVFVNLINNSYDALTTGGGTELCIRAVAESDFVVLTVQDDGPGLVEPDRVFDPFYTTKPVGQGTGLGLSLVHRMVADFGGSIETSVQPARGARFTLRLPRRAPAEAEVSPRVEPAPRTAAPLRPATGAPVRVLVVDDEEALRKLQAKILTRQGVEVGLAATGSEARELLSTSRFDLVISDVKMPGDMNGADLFHWVKREQPEMAERFVFVTGDSRDGQIADLFQEDPTRFLSKPFQPGEYLDFLRRVLPTLS